jgi:hypothetical protein
MKMALQIAGTTVVDNSRNLVNIAGGTVPNATNVTGTGTGSIVTSALATGTASSSTFLRGDRTWAAPPEAPAPTTNQVLTATAGASAGAVGTYALAGKLSFAESTTGETVAGSSLYYYYLAGDTTGRNVLLTSSPALSGTWRGMGPAPLSASDRRSGTIFLRIS